MSNEQVTALQRTACRVRQGVLQATHAAKSGHPGGSLGAADIFTALYFGEMKVDANNPKDPNRDRFVLSKGHTAPGLYSTLVQKGFFPKEDLLTLRRPGSHLQGHPCMGLTPGVDMSTGSLGQGTSAACGMALAAKKQNKTNRVYVLLGDGEIAEGQCWEAFLFAAHYKLDNLCVIVDLNGLQIDGATKDVMNTAPVDEKLKAFGFSVHTVNGNDFEQLQDAFAKARNTKDKPTAIVAHTVKGKGVSFMENQASWHGKPPNDEEYEKACKELQNQLQALGGEEHE